MELTQNCPNLCSLTIELCKKIGNESIQVIVRCCLNLQLITINNCPNVGDQGVATLLSSLSSVLKKVKLQSLNITDFSLAVIGHYRKSITNLALIGLQTASQKGFWAMGSAKGLQSLTPLTVVSCYEITDLSLEAIAKGCGLLKQTFVKKCCFVSDKGLISFTEAAELLECLQLEECNRISSETQLWQFCGMLCPQLQNLELSGLCGITDFGLYPILENCQAGLVKVNLSNCLNLTDKVVVDLARIHGETLNVFFLVPLTPLCGSFFMNHGSCFLMGFSSTVFPG
ncbi:putative leucine-rich repeat domain superfamily [Helianthus anomalus]